MTRNEKINAMREMMRDLKETSVSTGLLQVTLVHAKVREWDELVNVTIEESGEMTVSGMSAFDGYDWTEPISEQTDAIIDTLYDAMVKHAEWYKRFINS